MIKWRIRGIALATKKFAHYNMDWVTWFDSQYHALTA
jgi:hypothetical protein